MHDNTSSILSNWYKVLKSEIFALETNIYFDSIDPKDWVYLAPGIYERFISCDHFIGIFPWNPLDEAGGSVCLFNMHSLLCNCEGKGIPVKAFQKGKVIPLRLYQRIK